MTVRGVSVFDDRPVELSVRGDSIAEIRPIEGDPTLPYLAPGFFDIQVNGYGGVDYGYGEPDRKGMEYVVRSLAAAGITHHLPTVITNTNETILRKLALIRKALEESSLLQKAIPGVHLEGPFISPEDGPRGAHDPSNVIPPDAALFEGWQEAAGGAIKIITLAPEGEGAIAFIEKVSAMGTICAIGHTGADPGIIREATAAGARLSTHLGNGSHAMLPRLRNHLWEQLAEDSLAGSIICDGFHLPASVVKVMRRVKGPGHLILIGDSTSLTGKAPGVYPWGNTVVEVREDGQLVLSGTPYLAGAGHLFDWDIPRYIGFTGAPVAEAVRLCTTNPAQLLGMDRPELKPGAPASFALFRLEHGATRLKVDKTVLEGLTVHETGMPR